MVKRLEGSPELLNECKNIIKEQEEGIIEKAPEETLGREIYLPFKPVLRKSAESTKTRLVYNGSARATSTSPSLNEYLEMGPPLQKLIIDITARN